VGSGGVGDGDVEGRWNRVAGAAALDELELVESTAELVMETRFVA
jgi:hypothetical protein